VVHENQKKKKKHCVTLSHFACYISLMIPTT